MAVQAVLVARLVEVPLIMARSVTPAVGEQTTPIHMGSHDGHDKTFHEKQINYIISRSELLSSLSLVETSGSRKPRLTVSLWQNGAGAKKRGRGFR